MLTDLQRHGLELVLVIDVGHVALHRVCEYAGFVWDRVIAARRGGSAVCGRFRRLLKDASSGADYRRFRLVQSPRQHKFRWEIFLTLVVIFTRRRFMAAGIAAAVDMPRAGFVLEVRRAQVVDVLGVESAQRIGAIDRRAAGVVGAQEAVLVGIERGGFVEIQVSYVIDRHLVVETQAVGRVEFHGARVLQRFGY